MLVPPISFGYLFFKDKAIKAKVNIASSDHRNMVSQKLGRIVNNLPKPGIIGEAEKIADMRWIGEVFKGLIINES
jgi:hypothetical protein